MSNESEKVSSSTSVLYGKPVGGFEGQLPRDQQSLEGRSLLNVGGVEVDCIRLGRGEPILVLHGRHGRRVSMPFLRRMAESFEVIAPSHPGFDGSPRDERLGNVADLAEFYAEFREEVAPGCDVVGLSFGGWIAAHMAATVARDIRRLALVSPIGLKAGQREDRDYIDVFITDRDVVLSAEYGDRSQWPDFEAWEDNRFLELARSEEALAWYAWQPYLHDPRLPHRLRRIAAKVLVVSGAKDGFILNPTVHREMVRAIGDNARLAVVDEAHLAEVTNPDAVAGLIASFLAEAPQTQLAAAQTEKV